MVAFLIRRLLALIPTIFIVALITFILMHAAPGGPWDTDPGKRQVDARTEKALNAKYGLDKPPFFNFKADETTGQVNPFDSQFFNYIWGAVRGDLGPSFRQRGREVQDILIAGLPYTAKVAIIALLFALLIGIPLGVIAALRQNTWVDYLSLFVATAGVGVPNFIMALFAILLFGRALGWIPIVTEDWGGLRPYILPALVLSLGTASFLTRLTRSSMLDVIRQDYVRTARSKGLASRVVVIRHMLKNALIPVITVLGPALAGFITGSFFIENVFSVPGIGRLYVTAIGQRDYSIIMGTTLFYAVLIAIANVGVDLSYAVLDPRIKLGD